MLFYGDLLQPKMNDVIVKKNLKDVLIPSCTVKYMSHVSDLGCLLIKQKQTRNFILFAHMHKAYFCSDLSHLL